MMQHVMNEFIQGHQSVAACSSKYKDMVGLKKSSVIHHKHEGKESKVKEAVRVIKHDLINPFQHNFPDLINNGQKASNEAQKDLTTLEKIRLDAINRSLDNKQPKIIVKTVNT